VADPAWRFEIQFQDRISEAHRRPHCRTVLRQGPPSWASAPQRIWLIANIGFAYGFAEERQKPPRFAETGRQSASTVGANKARPAVVTDARRFELAERLARIRLIKGDAIVIVDQSFQLPPTGFVRVSALVGKRAVSEAQAAANRARGKGPRRARAGMPGLLGIGPTTLWALVQAGKFPRPVKLTPRVSAWPVEQVREWIDSQTQVAA
jgi:predicted DNA-binding transcriptional regulator AlpA